MTTKVQIINHGPQRVKVSTVDQEGTATPAGEVNAEDVSPPIFVYDEQSVLVEEIPHEG